MTSHSMTQEELDELFKGIGYSAAQLQKDLPELRQWLDEQIHLPQCRLKEPDVFLRNFLVGCKGSIEKAKAKLDHYYSLRGKGELFSNRSNLDYMELNKNITALYPMEVITPDCSRIMCAHLLNDDVDLYHGTATLKVALLAYEYMLRDSDCWEPMYYIMDGSKYTLSHFVKLSPTNMRSYLSFFQDANPFRVKKIIIANTPSVLATAINTVILPLMSKKMKDRLIITTDPVEKTFEFVELLPGDYEGGKQCTIIDLNNKFLEKVKNLSFLPELEEEVDEKKRPQLNGKASDPYFGLHGSIKTLVLD